MAATSSQSGPITSINMTPFVDIALVLLIIFIVTAKLVVTPSVPLDLPQATKSEEVQTILSVIVTAEGEVLANGAPMANEEALGSLARSHLERDPHLRVVIAADGAVAHRRVIGVLDTLRVAGISRVAFGVSPTNATSENR
ncbi:MAG: biopolymer transporter ExbD [Armatimonadetes bacterium]|nr:biopolymer transporter ExbD [Armatimonadota bacterium]